MAGKGQICLFLTRYFRWIDEFSFYAVLLPGILTLRLELNIENADFEINTIL